MKLKMLSMLLVLGLGAVSCTPNKKELKEILVKNPDIITDVIKENPVKFIEALNAAVQDAQKGQAKKREDTEKQQLEESFNKPLIAKIRKDESIRGTKGAALTLVEYSDFECPFCTRGYKTVLTLLEKYKGKIQFIYKHVPLSFHANAMPASQYYEAIRLQNEEVAYAFHDEIFKNQSKLKLGDKFLKGIAKKLKVDMKKLAKDIKSKKVKDRIQQDLDEAKKFGFNGTPGFLINGVPVRGAYPPSHFDGIIDELVKRGKVKL